MTFYLLILFFFFFFFIFIFFFFFFFFFFFSAVPVGGTLTMMVNMSVDNQQAEFVYLGKGSPLIRIIKLLKGENGSGTCYHANPWCKKNYGLRHSGEKTLITTLRDVTKSMEGCYRVYPYCLGSNHHCTIDQPLKSFMLSVEGKVRWLTLTFHSKK